MEVILPLVLIVAVAAWLYRLSRNRQQAQSPAEGWAPIFDQRGWDAFEAAVRDYFLPPASITRLLQELSGGSG